MIDFTQIFTNTLSGIIINLPWFVLVYLGFKVIARELREGIKKIPSWIGQYEKIKQHQRTIDKALGDRT